MTLRHGRLAGRSHERHDSPTGSTRWALIGASDIAATRVIPAIRAHGGHISVVQSADS